MTKPNGASESEPQLLLLIIGNNCCTYPIAINPAVAYKQKTVKLNTKSMSEARRKAKELYEVYSIDRSPKARSAARKAVLQCSSEPL